LPAGPYTFSIGDGALGLDYQVALNPIPEPASLLLLAIGSLALLRRRKRYGFNGK
jgi:hypothetical protein